MRTPSDLFVAIALAGLVSWAGATPCQERGKCAQDAQVPGRVIMKIGEITPPNPIHHQKVSFDRLKTPISPNVTRVAFVVLINEKGLVECVEYQDGAEGNQELVDLCTESLRNWQFEQPKDAEGKSVACFDLVFIRIRK